MDRRQRCWHAPNPIRNLTSVQTTEHHYEQGRSILKAVGERSSVKSFQGTSRIYKSYRVVQLIAGCIETRPIFPTRIWKMWRFVASRLGTNSFSAKIITNYNAIFAWYTVVAYCLSGFELDRMVVDALGARWNGRFLRHGSSRWDSELRIYAHSR